MTEINVSCWLCVDADRYYSDAKKLIPSHAR